jgi:hypothetical protein
MRDLIYHPKDHTYTYVPTGEKVNAECLDEFANKKLQDAFEKLAAVVVKNLINGTVKS